MSQVPPSADQPAAIAIAKEPESHPSTSSSSPLRNGNFRLLISGQLISNMGDLFYTVALPWYMLTSGGGAQNLGLVLLSNGVPRIGTTLLGGALADRLRPRRVMLVADWARTLIVGGLAALIIFRQPTLWQLCALSALLGAFSGLFDPGALSILPDLLPDEQLQSGNAFTSASTQFATLVGSVLGGVIVSIFKPGLALAIDAGTFLASALSLMAMRVRRIAKAAPAGASQEQAAQQGQAAPPPAEQATPMSFGKLLATSRLLQAVLIVALIGNLTVAGMLEVALPTLTRQLPDGSATAFGVLVAAFGAGALLGSLGAGILGSMPKRGIVMMLLWLAQAILIGVIPFIGSVPAVAGTLAAFGLANGLSNVFAITAIQQKMPRELLGRVMSILVVTSLGAYPVSVALAGFVTQHYGPTMIFVVSGALIALATLYGLFQRELRQL